MLHLPLLYHLRGTSSPPQVSRYRRMSKDYERKVQTSETLIEVAMIRLLVARQGARGRGV